MIASSSSSFIGLLLGLACMLMLTASVSSTTYTFDITQEVYCQAPVGCPFTNLTIWGPNVTSLPAQGDTVNVTGSGNYSILIYYPSGSNYTIGTLLVSAAEFAVNSNASFYVNTFMVMANSFLYVDGVFNSTGGGSIVGYVAVNGGNLQVQSQTQLWGGVMVDANATSSFGTIVYYNTAYVQFDGPTTIQGYTFVANQSVSFPNGLPVAAPITIPQYSSVMIANSQNIMLHATVNGSLMLENVSGYLYPTGTANATITLNSTVLSAGIAPGVNATYSGFVGSFHLINSNLTIANMQLNNVVSTGSQLHANNSQVSMGVVDANSQWMASGSWFNLTGSVDLLGSLTVTPYAWLVISNSAYIVATGTSQFNIMGSQGNNSAQVWFGGYLAAPLQVPAGTTMTLTGNNATIFGNVVNHGHLVLSGDHPLTIYGNFAHDGLLDVMLTGDNDEALHVNNGSLSVNGPLRYSMEKTPFLKNEKFLVIQLTSSAPNASITGTFYNNTATALAGSALDRDLKVEYTPTAIYVVYGFHVKDVKWWVWLLGALAIVAVIGILAGIIYKCRSNRKDYEPVR